MTDLPPKTPDWDDAQSAAAEYALGLLRGDALIAADRRMADDPAFRAEVEAWQNDLAGMAEGIAPVQPPARVRRAIETRLFGAQPGWRGRLMSRRGLLAGLAGVTAVALLAVALPDLMRPEGPAMMASLATPDGSVLLAARVEGDTLAIERLGAAAPEGRDMELWLIPADGVPRSIGVIPVAERTAMVLSPQILASLAAGTTLAISDEPAGGSPTGQPTGAVLASGTVTLG